MEIVIGISAVLVLLVIAGVLWGTGLMGPERGAPGTHTQVPTPQETGRTTGIN